MYKTINLHDFVDAFEAAERGEQYSYAAKKALYEHLTEYEEDTGEQIELDIIAICCDWIEYKDLAAIQVDYPYIMTLDDLQEYTIVLLTDDDTILIQQF